MRGRVLIVDDDHETCTMLETALGNRGFIPAWRTCAQDAFSLILSEEFDAVVTDLNMRQMNGIELCARIAANRSYMPVIVITAFGNMETAVAAMRAGAYDFITKPFDVEQLAFTLDRAVQNRRLRDEVKRLQQALAEAHHFESIIGASPPMQTVFDFLSRLRDSNASVLVTGETGTGKDLVARAIHRQSHRAGGPFVAISCAAVPEHLLESQLFGHAKGAFTDARESRVGLFQQANGGTLFLDEIGDMPLSLQPKILRALQNRIVRPIGHDAELPFDARIIAATNCDLEAAVEEGKFRSDLFFRINVIQVSLPPLRARGNDILLLAQHFMERFSVSAKKKIVGITPPCAEKLLSYSWPGNVRELQNCIERAVALTTFDQLTVEDLPEKIRDYRQSHVIVTSDNPEELASLEEVERRYILRVLKTVGGNKSQAAHILGLDRKTLYRKLEQYGPSSRED